MKKVLSVLVALFLFGSLNAQTPLLDEDFSNGIPNTWTMHSDGKTVATNISGIFGNNAWVVYGGCAVAPSWFNPAGQADRWLITPALAITDANTSLRFFMGSQDPNYLEALNVKISTTGTAKEDFTNTALEVASVPGNMNLYIVSLAEYVGQTIHIAFQLVSNDCFWLNLDDVYVGTETANSARILGISTPAQAELNASISVEITLQNMGSEPITNFSSTYTVNGTTSAAYNVTGVNVASGATYTFTHNATYTPTSYGVKRFSPAVTAINGTAAAATNPNDVICGTLVANPADAVARTPILEQFTTEQCGYCPAGTQRIKQALDSRSDNVIWLSHHAGFGTDKYTCQANIDLTAFYGGSTFAPAMMVNRTRVVNDANYPGPVVSVSDASTINQIIDAANQPLTFGSVFFYDMAYDEATRTITGVVGMRMNPNYIPIDPRISVFYSEDSLVSTTQGDYTGTLSGGVCTHMNVARACLTASFGDQVVFNGDGEGFFNINFTVPENFDPNHATLVAILSNFNASDINANTIINAAESYYISRVGISQASNIEMSIFPNPATDVVNVVAEESINSVRVMNALGQVVYTNNNVNAESMQLNVNDYAAGMYIITVNTDKGTSTQRVMVR